MTDQLKQAKRIRRLNDKLRRELPHGSVVISREVGRQFSNDQLQAITELIRRYDVFGPDADPDEWHGYGLIDYDGEKMIWRVEVLAAGPTVRDPSRLTIRIMFDHEARRHQDEAPTS